MTVNYLLMDTNKHKKTILNEIEPTDDISDFFPEKPPMKTIQILVQLPSLPPDLGIIVMPDKRAESARIRDDEALQEICRVASTTFNTKLTVSLETTSKNFVA
ncbi:MAG: hypothetical protein JOS17DRAFT_791918 [Linnemannia elongata]|nr:MAG: hypothetical protein JOS17DRAFT_791918 [Linnemannia elongata]